MESLEEIYQKHAQTVYAYLLSRTRNRDLAEELTQETFYQAFRSLEKYDGSCKLSTWLCGIARTLYAAYVRKHPVMLDLDDSMIADAWTDQSGKVRLLKAIQKLDGLQREVVYLRMYGDLSFANIADVLGRSENWARVTFYRAKEKLRKEMKNDE